MEMMPYHGPEWDYLLKVGACSGPIPLLLIAVSYCKLELCDYSGMTEKEKQETIRLNACDLRCVRALDTGKRLEEADSGTAKAQHLRMAGMHNAEGGGRRLYDSLLLQYQEK